MKPSEFLIENEFMEWTEIDYQVLKELDNNFISKQEYDKVIIGWENSLEATKEALRNIIKEKKNQIEALKKAISIYKNQVNSQKNTILKLQKFENERVLRLKKELEDYKNKYKEVIKHLENMKGGLDRIKELNVKIAKAL